MTLTNIYGKMLEDFGSSKELISVNYICNFENFLDCFNQGVSLFKNTKNDILEKRLSNEVHFHSFLKDQLFARLQEIKYYSNVNILDTRRLISVSTDCISTIHLLIRDKIYLNVYFRSSDFDGALPVDLQSICTIPRDLIKHLNKFKNDSGYEEVNDEVIDDIMNKQIQLNIMFGSLHRTK